MAVRGIKWPGRAKLVISLIAIRNGECAGKRLLDGREVRTISSFLDDPEYSGPPAALKQNARRLFPGSIFLGEGFILSHSQASQFINSDAVNREVIFPVINGQEVNNFLIKCLAVK